MSGRLQNGDSDKLSPRKPREKLVYKDQIAATGIFFSSLLGGSVSKVVSVQQGGSVLLGETGMFDAAAKFC